MNHAVTLVLVHGDQHPALAVIARHGNRLGQRKVLWAGGITPAYPF
jgi:hypothetical protein